MNLAQAPNALPRPCGKQWVPHGRLAERRGREARGSGRLPGRGGRGQGAQSRERITTGARPERALCDYERARVGLSPAHTWTRQAPGLLCSCMHWASMKAVQELHVQEVPGTLTRASSCSLCSKSWGLCSFSPNGKGRRHDSLQVTQQVYRGTQAPRPPLCLLAIFEPFCGGEGLTYEALVGTAGLVLGGIFQ